MLAALVNDGKKKMPSLPLYRKVNNMRCCKGFWKTSIYQENNEE